MLQDMYPVEYEMIRDPQGREWRDHAIIPWVDAERLVSATEAALAAHRLTLEEATRNTLMSGRVFKFSHGSTVQNTTTLPGMLSTRPVRCISRSFAPLAFPDGRFHPVVPAGCHTGRLRPPPAYPTLRFLKTSFSLQRVGVKVLHSPSHLESMVVTLTTQGAMMETAGGSEGERKALASAAADPVHAAANASAIVGDVRRARAQRLAEMLLGKHCFLGYPYASGGKPWLPLGVFSFHTPVALGSAACCACSLLHADALPPACTALFARGDSRTQQHLHLVVEIPPVISLFPVPSHSHSSRSQECSLIRAASSALTISPCGCTPADRGREPPRRPCHGSDGQ